MRFWQNLSRYLVALRPFHWNSFDLLDRLNFINLFFGFYWLFNWRYLQQRTILLRNLLQLQSNFNICLFWSSWSCWLFLYKFGEDVLWLHNMHFLLIFLNVILLFSLRSCSFDIFIHPWTLQSIVFFNSFNDPSGQLPITQWIFLFFTFERADGLAFPLLQKRSGPHLYLWLGLLNFGWFYHIHPWRWNLRWYLRSVLNILRHRTLNGLIPLSRAAKFVKTVKIVDVEIEVLFDVFLRLNCFC